jgi:hypothetical protein
MRLRVAGLGFDLTTCGVDLTRLRAASNRTNGWCAARRGDVTRPFTTGRRANGPLTRGSGANGTCTSSRAGGSVCPSDVCSDESAARSQSHADPASATPTAPTFAATASA